MFTEYIFMSPKRTKFVVEYIATGNAAEAARRAGYCVSGARQSGLRLLGYPDVKRAIARRQKKITEQYSIYHDRLVQKLLRVIDEADKTAEKVMAIRELAKLCGLYPGQCNCGLAGR